MSLTFFYLILFIMLMAFFQSPFFKGRVGEALVNLNNGLRLYGEDYQKIRDLTLRLKDGSTTQIDHVVLSPYGIFVIETKNMQGWIFGSEHQKSWTQSIYGKKYTFQNPLLQNYRHIKALEEVLNIKEGLFSIVTFVGESQFKTTMPKNVFYGGAYIGYIKSFKRRLFSDKELAMMVSRLNTERLKRGRATNREHIKGVKKRNTSYMGDPKITCSRCSSVMVERLNRKTKEAFLGCSAYPRCRHTETV
jgi:hypothetical protein